MIIENKVELVTKEQGNYLLVEKIKQLTNEYYLVFANDKQLTTNGKIKIKEKVKITLLRITKEDSMSADAVLYKPKLKELLVTPNNSYYDLKIDLNTNNSIELNKQELATSYFNEQPLFFKFQLEESNFNNEDLKLMDEDDNELKFKYLDFKNYQFIYFSKPFNKKAYSVYKNKKRLITATKANKSIFILKSPVQFTTTFIKWIGIKSNTKKQISLLIEYKTGSEIKVFNTFTELPLHRTNDFLLLNKEVVSIKPLQQESFSIVLNYENNLFTKETKNYLKKDKDNNFTFFAKEINFDLEQLVIPVSIDTTKEYIVIDNKLQEYKNGYLKFIKPETNNYLKIENFWFQQELNDIQYLEVNYKPDDFYLNNFASINTIYSGDLND